MATRTRGRQAAAHDDARVTRPQQFIDPNDDHEDRPGLDVIVVADDNDRYCAECGIEIVRLKKCSSCSQGNKPTAKFCSRCGKIFATNSLSTLSSASSVCATTSVISGMVANVPENYDFASDPLNILAANNEVSRSSSAINELD